MYVGEGDRFTLDLTGKKGAFLIREIEPETGKVLKEVIAKASENDTIVFPVGNDPIVYWVEAIGLQ